MSSSEGEGVSWRGVPITEIYGSQSPWGAPEFPLVAPAGFKHTVLYQIPSGGSGNDSAPPKPRAGSDVWNHDFVRMPCSSQSLYPVEDSSGETHLKKRWELIEDALSKPIRNSKELADAILSYNTKFKTRWSFRALHKLFEEYLEEEESKYFFDVTLPEIAKLALALPKLVQAPIPLLTQHKNRSVSLSQQQAASLLANAFFCTFPRRNTSKRESEYASYPYINFNRLFNATPIDRVMEKLKCICHYFRRVTTKVPCGVISFSRRAAPADGVPKWATSRTLLSSLPLHVDSKTTIEDADGLIQVDFANKFLGGGVLNTGCVQEEIRFVICPELILSMLFTEMLKPNEALMIIGCERFSSYSGYGSSFHWSGDFVDATPRDSSGRRRCAVLAIDALPYGNIRQEYTAEFIVRELNKAWIGVSFDTDASSSGLQYPGVATGNWGCGAFGGSPALKSLLQAAACAAARRPMAYYTFGDTDLRDDIIAVYNALARHNITVGMLYRYIMKFAKTDVRSHKLHQYLHDQLQDRKPKSPVNDDSNKMDISDVAAMDDAELLSRSTAKEFCTNFPDLFSQSDTDSNSEFKIDMDEDEALMDATENVEKSAANENDSEKKPSVDSKVTGEHTSRFFDEMQKLDDENSKLNLSATNVTPVRRADFKVTQSKGASDIDVKIDMSSEKKKKMGQKITDYFSKKSI